MEALWVPVLLCEVRAVGWRWVRRRGETAGSSDGEVPRFQAVGTGD